MYSVFFYKMEPRTLQAALRYYCQKELENAHDAMADVIATIELAKKIKAAQPKMFDYLYNMRHKRKLNELVDFCERLQEECGMPIASFGHAGDGNIHVNIMVEDIDEPAVRARSDEALDKLFKGVLAMGGAVSGEHGIGIAKKRWFSDALDDGALELHRRLKSVLDPDRVLNPGKFV